jgi:pimeloyl-ACP methyl ester carboxylesterase
MCRALVVALWLVPTLCVLADGPADNIPENTRRVPKLGIEVPPDVANDLSAGLARFEKMIGAVRERPAAAPYLPDVLVYYKAVHDALKYQEFFDPKELAVATELLAEGEERAGALAEGKTPWLDKVGPIVRGYVSKIDGSVQPYGLVVPASYRRELPHKWRLDFWFHGRGEVLSELNFVNDRRKNPGQFTPPDTIVLHPYGRYCNANKFAGEIDSFEALEACKKDYRIDDDRIAVRGFSMGGAACWQFAVHYPDRWFAAAPGAGFSETPDFLKVFQKETLNPTWYEKKLWHWYDCTDWALNLANLPTVAYSGEKDSQKQAADVMAVAFEKEGMKLDHIIGTGAGHNYTPEAKTEVDRKMDEYAKEGRKRVPERVQLVTYLLRYNRFRWLQIDGLEEHWKEGRVDATMDPKEHRFVLKTKGVTGLQLDFSDAPKEVVDFHVDIDGTDLVVRPGDPVLQPSELGGRHVGFDRQKKLGWTPRVLRAPQGRALSKRPGLQGPIDDAFLDSFILVRPTGKAYTDVMTKWTDSELARAIEHWRRHFRGEPRVKNDVDITEDDIKSSNLILWGDPDSNSYIESIATKLPFRWAAGSITVDETRYSTDHHALIAIYPNPKNPAKYVVLNSSFTFRDYAYLNNARQVPKLPDWAIVDLRTPPDNLWPGKIVDADFFDEQWQYKRSPERK